MSKSSSSEQLHWNADELPGKSSEASVSGRLSHSWPSGPRTVVLHRCDRGFGFTLRHFIVYPDEPSKNEGLPTEPVVVGSGGAGGRLSDHAGTSFMEPMDTIFVKHVKEGGPAQKAGLNTGDRVVSVNGETVVGKSYSHVVQLIQRSGNVLQLLVVPKEDDILQLYFPGTAYRSSPECQQTVQDITSSSDNIGSRAYPTGLTAGSEGMLLAENHLGRPEVMAAIGREPVLDLSRRRFSELLPSYRAEVASVMPAASDWSLSSVGLGGRMDHNQVNASHRSLSTCALPQNPTSSTAPDLITKPTPYGNLSSNAYGIGGRRFDSSGRPPWATSVLNETALRPQSPASEYFTPLQPKYSESQESGSLQDTPPPSVSSLSSREPSIEHPDLLPESIISRLRATFEKKEEFLLRTTGTTPSSPAGSSSLSGSANKDNFNPFPPLHPTANVTTSKESSHSHSQKPRQDQPWPPPMGQMMTSYPVYNEESISYRHPKPFISNLSRIQENIQTPEASSSSSSTSRTAGIGMSSQIRRLGEGGLVGTAPRIAPILGSRQLLMLKGETTLLRKANSLDSELLPSMVTANGKINQTENGEVGSLSMDAVTWDDINGDSTSAVHLVSRRARQFEQGVLERESNLRMNLYKNELSRMTTRGQTPKVSDRAARFESLSTSQETLGSESDHCPSPRQKNLLKKEASVPSGLMRQIDVTTKGQLGVTVPYEESDAQRHKAKRQNSYLTALNTPFEGSARPGAAGLLNTLSPPSSTTGVLLRRKTVFEEEEESDGDSEDGRPMRRVSYLRATSGEVISNDVDGVQSSSNGQLHQLEIGKGSATAPRSQSIQKLKAFFGERAPHISESLERRPLREYADNSQTSPGIVKEGWLHCKMAAIDGKRATDRSWKQLWVVLKDSSLHLYKEKKDSIAQAMVALDEQHPIDLKNCRADIATDYTKKKHVFRLSTLAGSEYLLQADSNAEMQRWIRIIQDNLNFKTNDSGQGMVPRNSSVSERDIGGRLSPQPGPKGIRKLAPFRSRSPTGHSPTSKSRKSSQGGTDDTSPKSKTWRGKMVKTIRKIHGTSPTSATQPEGLTIGVPLEFCPASSFNEFVPLLLELCTSIVEARGLEVIGIYRVPGNTTAVSFLMDAVNHGFDCLNLRDPKWSDMNVISSLLKAFFRKLPEPLVTAELYPFFIEASKSDDPVRRVYGLKKVLQELPDHNYETLKFLIEHLRRVVAHSNINKMEARNLAIVFGPTLVRAADDNMVTMVTDMSYQCRIVEMLLNHGDWFFNGDENDDACIYENLPYENGRKTDSNCKQVSNQNLLLNNVQKMGQAHDMSKSRDVTAKDLVSNIIGAANRKVRQKIKKHNASVSTSCEDNERNIDHEIELRLRTLKPKYGATRSSDADQKSMKMTSRMKTERRHSEDNSAAASSIRAVASDDFAGVRKMSVDSLEAGQLPERIFCVVRQPSSKSTWSGEGLDTLSEHQQNEVDSDSLSTEKSLCSGGDAASRSNGSGRSMQERIRRFEMETKALLQRNLHHRQKRELDRHRVEADWQRTKKELVEQSDYFDRLPPDTNPLVNQKISDFTQKMESLNALSRSSESSQSDMTSSTASSFSSTMRPITDGTINHRRAKPLAERTLATAWSARPQLPVPSRSEGERGGVGLQNSASRAAFNRVGSIENCSSGGYDCSRRDQAERQRPLSMVRPRPRVSQSRDDGNGKADYEYEPSQLKSRFCGSLDSLREFYETTKENEGVPCRPPRLPLPHAEDRRSRCGGGDDVRVQRNENTRITATLSPSTHTVSTTSTTTFITATIVSGSSMHTSAASACCSQQQQQPTKASGPGDHERLAAEDEERMESEVPNGRSSSGNAPSPSLRRKSSHLRNLKRRHTVGGTKDFEKFRLLVGSSIGDGNDEDTMEVSSATRRGHPTGWSAWERLRPAVSEDGFQAAAPTVGRSMKSWLQRERLRTSTPDLLSTQRAPSSDVAFATREANSKAAAAAAQNKSALESQV